MADHVALTDFPVLVVNLPGRDDRRTHAETHLGGLGIAPVFVDGVAGQRKIRGAAGGHINAHDAAPDAPFIVMEDDVRLARPTPVLPPLPRGADAVYLGTHTGGCLPNRPENKALFGHRHFAGFALATDHDADWLRLHSMISAHAILFLTARARAAYREELRIAEKRRTPLDVRFAYLMSSLDVFAPRTPVFVECQGLQSGAARGAERRRLTHDPLPVAREGERRTGEKRGWRVTVEATRCDGDRFHWEIVSREALA